MAYEFVYESEAKRYRSDCTNVLKETCELLKEKGISAQFSLVGSGARNMITRNGDGPYDLDYNLLVMKADNEYRDPRLLKDTIRNALNKAVGGKFFSDAQDSTSCLTAILYFEKSPDIKFKFIYSILYKPCIFKAYRLLNVQTLCIFPCFCPYEPKQGKFLFSADYLIQQSCGSTLRFPCSVSVNVHCGTDISVSEKFLHIFRCCTV